MMCNKAHCLDRKQLFFTKCGSYAFTQLLQQCCVVLPTDDFTFAFFYKPVSTSCESPKKTPSLSSVTETAFVFIGWSTTASSHPLSGLLFCLWRVLEINSCFVNSDKRRRSSVDLRFNMPKHCLETFIRRAF